EQHLSLEDDASKIDFTKADHRKVAEMILQNKLCFSDIKVFSLKMYAKTFAFIFASSREDAIEHFRQELNKEPLNCFEYDLDFLIAWGNDFISCSDMRKEYNACPVICGFY